MTRFSRKTWIIISIIGGIIILFSWLFTPTLNQVDNGSTYGKFPDGYSAWYALMEDRKTPIKRWKKQFPSFLEKQKNNPVLFLRIYGQLNHSSVTEKEINWIKQGNTLVILGKRKTVTEAPFSSQHDTPHGKIKIETTRRSKQANQIILEDQFGAIVWEEKIGEGQVIYATTPYLAANAYQTDFSNHEFLAELVESYNPKKIWVDEYIHGYRDSEIEETEEKEDLFSYFKKTPLTILLIQALVILLIALWHHRFRLGKSLTLTAPATNNSKAYIDALASLLQNAESRDFITDILAKEEQRQLQRKLGIKTKMLDDEALIEAWVQQTGQPATKLKKLLQLQSKKHRLSNLQLLDWMRQWQTIQNDISKNQ